MDLLNRQEYIDKYLNDCCYVYFRVKIYKYDIKGSALNSGFAFAWLLRMHILTGYLI